MPARTTSRASRTLSLAFQEEEYHAIVEDTKRFRQVLTQTFAESPELFSENFAEGFEFKDSRTSKKQNLKIRRIELKNGDSYSIRPSFVTSSMRVVTKNVYQDRLQ